jgi:hypothetical protein
MNNSDLGLPIPLGPLASLNTTLPNVATEYLDGTGNFSTPSAGGLSFAQAAGIASLRP